MIRHGGYLVWEIGSGYFGCRTDDGMFSEERLVANASAPQVKMIELKLSQGAKPGRIAPGMLASIVPDFDVNGAPKKNANPHSWRFVE